MSAKPNWIWIDSAVIFAVHEEQLAEHGGAAGIRDTGMLESTLARRRNLARYAEPDASALAAAYGFGLARNHPFVDGNKRSAFVAVELFLHLNGLCLDAPDADCVMVMLSLAAGEIDEPTFAAWLRERVAAR